MKTTLVALSICALAAMTAVAQTPATSSKPVSAAIVNPPKDITDWSVGDIEVTFADGHKEIFSKGENGGHPQVSSKGDVGWSVWNDKDKGKYEHTGETLRIRLVNGTTKNFKPNGLFIMNWHFVDNDSAVVISSMDHHGPTLFIKYDLKSGKNLGQVDEYEETPSLPKWARPFADD